MSHPLFTPEVRVMMQEGNSGEMRTFVETLHPATIAEALTDDDIPPETIWRILEKTSIRDQATVFEYFPIELQVEMALGAGQPHMARLIEQMSHDDRAALLRRLPPRLAEGLLRLVDEADRRDIKQQLEYPEDSVGALMTTDYAWLPVNLRAGEAIDRLRLQAPNSETIYYVYILDEATRRLLGVVTLRDLVLAQRQVPLHEIMETEIVSLKADWNREQAAQEMRKYDLIAMPVVDDSGRLVGIVTHDDVIDVVVEEATEDAHRMGAIMPMTENYLEANFFFVWRSRAFWLSCLFGAELFTFTALATFEDEIAKLVVLSLFVPLCISTGGNSGSQAATLITRALALGQIHQRQWLRVLRHELWMGLVLGLTLGLIGFTRGYMTPADIRGGSHVIDEPFAVRVPTGTPIDANSARISVPGGAEELRAIPRDRVLVPPEGGAVSRRPDRPDEYQFPAGTMIKEAPVPAWRLGLVIGLAVAAICLWGTLVGSMLPLIFKSIGVDPGIASSPFVATFVDVTGIIIYFSIAKAFLL